MWRLTESLLIPTMSFTESNRCYYCGDVREVVGNVVKPPSVKGNDPYHATLSGITADQAEELFRPTQKNPSLKNDWLV